MKRYLPFVVAFGALALGGCHWDMWEQPKAKAQDESPFFASASVNSSSTRPPVEGTVQFHVTHKDEAFYTGYLDGKLVKEFPIPVTKQLIERGKERFTIFCTPCHGQLGDGKGMIATRGFSMARPVATYHTDRLRQMPVGHFFDVVTNGYGAMFPFAARIKPADRWAIVSYIRVLQLSQGAKPEDLDGDSAKALGVSAASGTGPLFVSPETAPTTVTPPAPPAGELTPSMLKQTADAEKQK